MSDLFSPPSYNINNKNNQILYFASILSACIAIIIMYNIYLNFDNVRATSLLNITSNSENEYDRQMTELNLIAAIFLLILAVSGNFVAEVFPCQLQRYLSKNMIAKQIIIFMIIYFTLSFTTDKKTHPKVHFYRSLSIYLFFLLFNKMSIIYNVISITLLFIILVIKNFLDYYHSNNMYNDEYEKEIHIKPLILLANMLFSFLIFVILFGFFSYFLKQYNDYRGNFNMTTFLFGKPVCFSN